MKKTQQSFNSTLKDENTIRSWLSKLPPHLKGDGHIDEACKYIDSEVWEKYQKGK